MAAFLNAIAVRADVAVIDPTPALCNAATNHCPTEIDGRIIYRDAGHLSYEGSVVLAQRMHLDSEVRRLAR